MAELLNASLKTATKYEQNMQNILNASNSGNKATVLHTLWLTRAMKKALEAQRDNVKKGVWRPWPVTGASPNGQPVFDTMAQDIVRGTEAHYFGSEEEKQAVLKVMKERLQKMKELIQSTKRIKHLDFLNKVANGLQVQIQLAERGLVTTYPFSFKGTSRNRIVVHLSPQLHKQRGELKLHQNVRAVVVTKQWPVELPNPESRGPKFLRPTKNVQRTIDNLQNKNVFRNNKQQKDVINTLERHLQVFKMARKTHVFSPNKAENTQYSSVLDELIKGIKDQIKMAKSGLKTSYPLQIHTTLGTENVRTRISEKMLPTFRKARAAYHYFQARQAVADRNAARNEIENKKFQLTLHERTMQLQAERIAQQAERIAEQDKKLAECNELIQSLMTHRDSNALLPDSVISKLFDMPPPQSQSRARKGPVPLRNLKWNSPRS
jgi:hypothetical protein